MKRLWLVILLVAAAAANAQAPAPLQYGVPATINFKLFNTDGTIDVDEADGGTEVSLVCDEAAPVTATNDFVDEGSDYSIALTAAEMRCARISVYVAATVLNVFQITTFGDLNAQDKTRGIASGVAQSGSASGIVLAAPTAITDARAELAVIQLTNGTGEAQRRLITDQVGDTLTVSEAWTTPPDSTTEYIVHSGLQGFLSCGADGICLTDLAKVSGDTTAGDNAETFFDGAPVAQTGDAFARLGAPLGASVSADIATLRTGVFLYYSTVTTVTSQTQLVGAADPGGANSLINRQICIQDLTDGNSDCAWIDGFDNGANRFTLSRAMRFTVATGDLIRVYPAERGF